MKFDGKRVDVQRAADDLASVSGGELMPADPHRQGFVELAALVTAGQSIHQPPVGRLAGQALLEHLLAGAVPGGELHCRVVRQRVGVVLVCVAEGQAVEVLAEQFDLRVACAGRIALVEEPGGQVSREAESVIDFAEQQCAGVGSNSRIGLTNLDRAVKGRLKQPSLAFTHWVHLRSVR